MNFLLIKVKICQIDKEGENKVSVQELLLELRKYRMGLIQTYDQLTFSYEAIIEGMRRMNNDVSISQMFNVFPMKSFFPSSARSHISCL